MKQERPSRSPTALDAIGGTPIVQLRKIVPRGSADVFVKLEYFNPTGSYKDRMAFAMIDEAEKRGDLRPGMTVVEYTGGEYGFFSCLRVRGQRVSLSSGLFGCVCQRETADDEGLWRGSRVGAQ